MTDPHIPPRPTGPDESRSIPPHGPVSPDGSAPWPQPSPAARAVVYGGLALAVAGLTVGTVYLGRRLAGSDEPSAAATLRVAAPQQAPRRHRPSALAGLAETIEEASTLLTTVLAASRRLAAHGSELSDQIHAFSDLWRRPPATGKPAAGEEDAAPGRAGFSKPGDARLHRL